MKLLVAFSLAIDKLKIDQNKELPMARTLQGLRHWLAEALEFTLGNPNEGRHLPPPIGPQPYSDKPGKTHY